jgi:hypothetical protein
MAQPGKRKTTENSIQPTRQEFVWIGFLAIVLTPGFSPSFSV